MGVLFSVAAGVFAVVLYASFSDATLPFHSIIPFVPLWIGYVGLSAWTTIVLFVLRTLSRPMDA